MQRGIYKEREDTSRPITEEINGIVSGEATLTLDDLGDTAEFFSPEELEGLDLA